MDLEEEHTRNRLNLGRKSGIILNNWYPDEEEFEKVKIMYSP